jgi:hypothetical protein
MSEQRRFYIVQRFKKGVSLPYYATTNGFQQFDPFQQEPFCKTLLRFASEKDAWEYANKPEFSTGQYALAVEAASPNLQKYFDSLQSTGIKASSLHR